MSHLIDAVKNRYTTKAFDSSRLLTEAQLADIKTLLQFSPSSVNSQPWHFIIATTESGKQKIAKSTENYGFNTPKILNASAVVALCTKTTLDDGYLQSLLNQEQKDGRISDEASKQAIATGRAFFVGMHNNELKDCQHWMDKQVYLALGTLLLGAAVMGIDACPIEGFDASALNHELGLRDKGYGATVLVALGYRSPTDFNANLPKSRLAQTTIFTEI
ncbi:oxygen-insensitive NAD(P)H nitroreductase [Shewanella sp. NIFS-20-20]|uniref:oxygen-insensitive NAD(P)H nitroreductase n=1 Tax=Shewanella sp. NIFS-20-20 TaxID=2853806 RepID=UPI001C446622|nr:oxygen-insensitive NAD(P)H nitroreductase [Shewanella sp. NIFS-20-20]MBV7315842.1 oxygen-insensitive NAD(P)H nitroreductase [Shewanella sp. NIFS-20-20]